MKRATWSVAVKQFYATSTWSRSFCYPATTCPTNYTMWLISYLKRKSSVLYYHKSWITKTAFGHLLMSNQMPTSSKTDPRAKYLFSFLYLLLLFHMFLYHILHFIEPFKSFNHLHSNQSATHESHRNNITFKNTDAKMKTNSPNLSFYCPICISINSILPGTLFPFLTKCCPYIQQPFTL